MKAALWKGTHKKVGFADLWTHSENALSPGTPREVTVRQSRRGGTEPGRRGGRRCLADPAAAHNGKITSGSVLLLHFWRAFPCLLMHAG